MESLFHIIATSVLIILVISAFVFKRKSENIIWAFVVFGIIYAVLSVVLGATGIL